MLEIEDIPTECDLFSRHFKISEDGCEDCLINYTDISESLHKICQQTEKCDGIVFMGNQSGAYASSFIYWNGKVYTFDTHSISPITGMPCANGISVLLSFDNISKFAEYLVLCASVHHHAEQLTLWKLNISKMQQSEYRDSNLKNANIKLHTGKHKSNTIHSEVKDDPKKNSTITNCSEETESEHAEHSQQIESEQKVALTCEMCSKKLDNSYNLKLHREKCKRKAQKFICRTCSKKLDNSHALKLHEEKCKKKPQKFICRTCSKKLDNSYNLNLHETKCKKKYNETKITYKCNICSKILDNKSNLLQHEKACRKHHEAPKDSNKKKKGSHKSTLITQLESKYDRILNEENNISEKMKQIKNKITDRQHQILKLEKQISAHKQKNTSVGNYFRTQITHLEDQICKYKSLMQDLTQKKIELNSQKTATANHLQLLCSGQSTEESNIPNTNIRRNQQTAQNPRKRLASDLIRQTTESSESDTEVIIDIPAKKPQYSNSTDESDIPVTRQLSNTNITRNKETPQNPRKRQASDLIKQTTESSESDTDFNMDIPAKKHRYSNDETDEFDSNAHEKFQKSHREYMKEYMKNKHSSPEFRLQEKLQQREHKTQKCSSPEFRLQENVQKKEHMTQKRSSPEFRLQENAQKKEHMTQKRSSPEFRLQENAQKKKHMTQKRSSPEFRLQENVKKRSISHKNVHLLNSGYRKNCNKKSIR